MPSALSVFARCPVHGAVLSERLRRPRTSARLRRSLRSTSLKVPGFVFPLRGAELKAGTIFRRHCDGGWALALTLAASLACGAPPPRAAQAPEAQKTGGVRSAEPLPSQRVLATIVTPHAALDVGELFTRAEQEEAETSFRQAARLFDRIVQHDPQGPLTPAALLRSGLAWEQASDLHAAALRFEQLARRFPEHPKAREALVRSMRVRLHLGHYARAGVVADVFLERHLQGPPLSRIVARAAQALAALEGERVSEAEHFVGRGLAIVDRLRLDQAGRIPRDLAVLYYARGEARRQRAEAVQLDDHLATFAGRLEQRCELLLSAQAAYSDSMRAYDAHWSTIAGYRVGELYGRLHRELMALPPPSADTPRQSRLFEGAMRLRYSVLVDKALAMLDHVIEMARRENQSSPWVERSQAFRVELREASEAERRALDRLPFSRADLERALAELQARAQTPASH